MSLEYSVVTGNLYKKSADKSISPVNCQLLYVNQAQYSSDKWLDEFFAKLEREQDDSYPIEIEDDCY